MATFAELDTFPAERTAVGLRRATGLGATADGRILTMAVALGHHGPEIIISRNRQCDDAGECWFTPQATNVISVHHAASYALAVDLIENEVDKWLTQRD